MAGFLDRRRTSDRQGIQRLLHMWETTEARHRRDQRLGARRGELVRAHDAHHDRIGLVHKVVPHDQLLDECFRIVERIALVSLETMKINLVVTTRRLEMTGLHNAWNLNAGLSSSGHRSIREDFKRHFEQARNEGGMRSYIETRDAPFQPEPLGPHASARD